MNLENNVINDDCIKIMKQISDNAFEFVLCDIPYDAVNRKSNGLRNLDKDKADIITFDLNSFLQEVYRLIKGSCVIFCSKEQFSFIYSFFADKKGTVRPIIWEKSNPSPMNGQHIYLSGVEMAIWFKKSGYKTFNAHCKNTVFKYPNGSSKLHPTEKNHKLLADLIKDNTNEGDLIADFCCGSGSHLLVSKQLNRRYFGVELDRAYYDITINRLKD